MASNNTINAAHQNWQNLGANGLYGTDTAVGGGGSPVPRSALDAARMAVGRVPQAEYPDGYLGTIRSRRDDRGRPSSTSDTVLNSLKDRQTQRSYQRGVHKGERIDPSDYYYPPDLDPQRGLRNQAKGIKTAPLMIFAPSPHLVNDGKVTMPNTIPGQIDPRRKDQFSRLRPAWN